MIDDIVLNLLIYTLKFVYLLHEIKKKIYLLHVIPKKFLLSEKS